MNTYRFTLTYDAEADTPEEAWEQLHDDIYGSLDRREYNVPGDDMPEYSVLSETGYACIVCGQPAAVVDGSLRPACSEHDGLQDIFQVVEE